MNVPIDPNVTFDRFLLYMAVIVAFVIFFIVRTIYRNRTMKRFASEHQFQWLGSEAPDALYLRKTSFAWREAKITNSIQGNLRGIDVAVFDLAYDLPKEGSRSARTERQTVVAFRNQGALHCAETPSTGIRKFHLEIAGDWIIAYTENKIVAASKLEAWGGEVYDQAARLIQSRPAPSIALT